MMWLIVIAGIIAYVFIGCVVYFVCIEHMDAPPEDAFFVGFLWPIVPPLMITFYAIINLAELTVRKLSKK